jgi:hypothetical protein
MLLTSKGFLEFLLNFEHDTFIKWLNYLRNVLIVFESVLFVYTNGEW